MSKLKPVFFLILHFFFLSIINAQSYKIGLKIPQLKNEQIILGHYFSKANLLIPDDTTILDNKGNGVFTGASALTKGLYFILLPNKRAFDILITENQNFSVENDTVDLTKNLRIHNEIENKIFAEYQRFRTDLWNKNSELEKEYQTCQDSERKKEIENLIRNNYKAETIKKKEIIEKNPNLFISKLLKAMLEVEIPESITDQQQKYYYYRGNYFNYFDFKDQHLLRTPIYESKLDYYLDKVLPQIPDTLISEVDKLIENSRHDSELFRYMLVHLFQKYRTSNLMGSENVYIHIIEKYYLKEAHWSSEETIKELEADYNRKKNALIGMTAPEVKLIALPGDSVGIDALKESLQTMKENGSDFLKNESLIQEKIKLHRPNYPDLTDSALRSQVIISELGQILEEQLIPNFEGFISLRDQSAKYIILWFWDPECSHCKEETPKFSKAYDDKNLRDLGVLVIPVYVHSNINEWEKYTRYINSWFDFTIKHHMAKWLNVWEPFGYSHYRDKFDVSAKPTLYLLDKDKKIIAKRIGYDQAIGIIEEMEKNDAK